MMSSPFTRTHFHHVHLPGSVILRAMHYNSCISVVFWGHVAPTVSLRGPAQYTPFSHCLKNGVGAPSDDTIPTPALLDDVTASLQT